MQKVYDQLQSKQLEIEDLKIHIVNYQIQLRTQNELESELQTVKTAFDKQLSECENLKQQNRKMYMQLNEISHFQNQFSLVKKQNQQIQGQFDQQQETILQTKQQLEQAKNYLKLQQLDMQENESNKQDLEKTIRLLKVKMEENEEILKENKKLQWERDEALEKEKKVLEYQKTSPRDLS